MNRVLSCTLIVLALCWPPAVAEESVDLQVVSMIKEEGFDRSQVMDTLSNLVDVFGPRLTGSPGLQAASEWCVGELTKYGLKDARLESWGTFGRGWVLDKFWLDMTQPYYQPLIGYPKAWTRGTNGTLSGTPVLIEAESAEDLDKYKGQLKGKIVLIQSARTPSAHFEPDAARFTEEELEELTKARAGGRGGRRFDPARMEEFRRMRAIRGRMNEMLEKEGVAAILEPSRGEHGTLFVASGGSYQEDSKPAVPAVTVAVEHYGQIVRLLKKKADVSLELSVQARFLDSVDGYNVLAEIPGIDSELKDEVVMLGGHLDSWHASTGTTDNAAGCVVAMEAVRILTALEIHPRRTIRVALWSGEEQGIHGSREYVRKHFGERGDPTRAHDKFSAYFNLDNGTGRIRGVYCQGNDAVMPIFEAWLAPFHELEATTITSRNTGGTDHLSFDRVGLPGFQFIQDRIEYDTRTHHTNMDNYERAEPEDLKQASVIMASFVYHAAMRDEKLPRKRAPAREQTRDTAGRRAGLE